MPCTASPRIDTYVHTLSLHDALPIYYFSVLLRRDGQSQLVYKHAISTVMPAQPMNLSEIRKTFEDNHRKPRLLQEIFLNAVRKSGHPVTMFLVNGVMLQGEIAAYDLF